MLHIPAFIISLEAPSIVNNSSIDKKSIEIIFTYISVYISLYHSHNKWSVVLPLTQILRPLVKTSLNCPRTVRHLSRTETSFFLSYPNTQYSVVSKILQRKNKKRKESIFIVVV